MGEVMLLDNAAKEQPSLFQRLCLCQCGPKERKMSGLELVPELRGLAGVSVQSGEGDGWGSLQTLKWASYDPTTRVARMQVEGGFGGPSGSTGLWTAAQFPNKGDNVYLSILRSNNARLCNMTYKFSFSEDFMDMDIDLLGNGTCLCCLPCVPAWLAVPRSIMHFTARQSPGSKDGTSWDRYSSAFGSTPVFSYTLLEAWQADGSKGKYYDKMLATTPQQVMVTF